MIDRITIDPRICEGRPTIRGMRITVDFVLKLLGDGMDADQIVAAYPELEKEDVYQAAKYSTSLEDFKYNLDENLAAAKADPKRAGYFAVAGEMALESSKKAAKDPISALFSSAKPQPPTDWLDRLVFGSARANTGRLDASVPAELRSAAADFAGAKRALWQLSQGTAERRISG